MAGRPSKISDKLVKRLCQLLEEGNTRLASANGSGISDVTFYNWIKKAKSKDAPAEYVDFLSAIKEAEAKAETGHVSNIKMHSFRNWQASAWWLERRKPKDYGKQDRLDVTSKGEKIERKWEIVDPLPLNGLHTNGNGKKKQAEA